MFPFTWHLVLATGNKCSNFGLLLSAWSTVRSDSVPSTTFYNSVSISGQLVRQESSSANPSQEQISRCSSDHVRTDDQSRKVGNNSFPEIHMYWNGIPYILNGQSFRHSGTSDMVSSTNERFRVFRSLLGKLNVTAEFVVLGRLHLRPL